MLDYASRGRGWLRYLERKLAERPDDWSKEGRPAAGWDRVSGAPTTNWYRFDAIGVATTIALAAIGGVLDRATATRAIDGIVDRLRKYHGFNEWVEQTGPDPGRNDYPEAWRGTLIPEAMWGRYDSPGWAGNGSQESGFEPNPIEAQGGIYYKGFLNYVLGLRTLVDSDRQDEVIEVVYDDEHSYPYSHHDLNSILERDFANARDGRSDGLCCEIHKLWPL